MTRRVVVVDGIVPVTRGYPTAVISNGFVFVSGMRGQGDEVRWDSLPEKFRQSGFTDFPIADAAERRFAVDAWTAHEHMDRVLKAAGTNASQVLRQHMWLEDKRYFPIYEQVRMAWQTVPAPSSCLGVAAVAGRFAGNVGLESLAIIPGANPQFPERTTARSFDNKVFPSAAFYSQAVRCGPLVFLAGHIPIATDKPGKPVIAGFDDIPEQGRFLATGRSHPDSRQGPIAAQAWFTYDAIRENLAAQGLPMSSIKHVAVMLQDLRDMGAFHRVHCHFFPEHGPAMIVTGFNEVGHRGTRIEIEPTAIDPGMAEDSASIPWPFPAPFSGPAAVKLGPLYLFAGILGLNAAGTLVHNLSDIDCSSGRSVVADLARFESTPGFTAQCWAAWSLLEQLVITARLSLRDLVKTTVYLRSAADIWIYEEIREAFLPAGGRDLPAIEFVAIHGPGPVADAQVQIEATATTHA